MPAFLLHASKRLLYDLGHPLESVNKALGKSPIYADFSMPPTPPPPESVTGFLEHPVPGSAGTTSLRDVGLYTIPPLKD